MKTITYNNYTISVEKYSFSDTYVVCGYYICTISNSNDRYYMGFLDNGSTEDEVLKQCVRRLEHKNKCNLKIRTNNIHKFIEQYTDKIDKFNKDYDVEIREV